MKNSSKILLWFTLGLAVSFAILWQFLPLQDASERLNALPKYGPAFVGDDIPLTSFEEGAFKDVDLIKRVYTIANVPYFITAVDGTRNRHAVHDPYYCFHGGGWEVIADKPYPIPGGEARFVTLKKGDKEQNALYWFTDGKSRFGSALTFWWKATLRRLTFGKSGQEPVLVVVQPIESKSLPWQKLIELFPQLFQL